MQCYTFVNNSVIPDTQSYKTNAGLSSLSFENDDISICMIKICDSALVKLFCWFSKIIVIVVLFLTSEKKSNICPVHKKWQTNY